MSDMSAVEVIAGVLREHIIDIKAGSDDLWFCECGHVLGSDFTDGIDMVPHLAAVVDKALGGLRREAALSYSPPNDPDSATFHTDPVDIKALRTFLGSSVDVYRWIGGWTPEEAS